jgi:hypothetical protein
MQNVLRSTAVAFILALAALPAGANPVFGPDVFTKVQPSGTPDTYNNTFAVPANGFYMVWMQNGDEGSDRITNGSVVVGSITVASDVQFQGIREFFSRPVFLTTNPATPLTVTLTGGDPGAFLGIVVTPLADHFDLAVGRLILPYATAADTTIVLKNGAHRYHRFVRVHCYDGTGALQATSGPTSLNLAPAANEALTAAQYCGTPTNGTWTAGSLEVFWAGRGGARVFGTATTVDPNSGVKSLVEMEHAGYRHRDPYLAINQ